MIIRTVIAVTAFLFVSLCTPAGAASQPAGATSAKEKYQIAQKKFLQDDNEENTIWYGRRAAYLGNYAEAIGIYTRGLQKYPRSYRLYRHRGHRYISIRQFTKAVEDLEKAAQLVNSHPLEVEPDGIPNAANIPVSNTQFNIFYHLGLAHYLNRNYEKAVHAYKKCLAWSKNHDSVVAAADWLYMTYRRMGNKKDAEKLLELVTENMTLLENHSYYRRLLMYKGQKAPDTLLKADRDSGEDPLLTLVTQGYGVANWYYYNGDKKKALAIFKRIIDTKIPAAFGYIAAEMDLKHLK